MAWRVGVNGETPHYLVDGIVVDDIVTMTVLLLGIDGILITVIVMW